jgi:NMD protein affecting ribosome stability and mRNA decay
MRCDELYRLLNIYWRDEDRDIAFSLISAHVHACSTCARGLVQLSKALIAGDRLTCEQCRARFPVYYEATHPEYPLATMSETAVSEVALHLGHCAACREQYLALELISALEEEGIE